MRAKNELAAARIACSELARALLYLQSVGDILTVEQAELLRHCVDFAGRCDRLLRDELTEGSDHA